MLDAQVRRLDRGVDRLDRGVDRLDRGVDRLAPELRDLQRDQDGTEIKSRELELVTDRARNLGNRRDAFEKMRDAAADAYREETGDTWRPRHGSHASQTGKLTSAAIDARDFMRARKDRATMAHLPQGAKTDGEGIERDRPPRARHRRLAARLARPGRHRARPTFPFDLQQKQARPTSHSGEPVRRIAIA